MMSCMMMRRRKEMKGVGKESDKHAILPKKSPKTGACNREKVSQKWLYLPQNQAVTILPQDGQKDKRDERNKRAKQANRQNKQISKANETSKRKTKIWKSQQE